MSETEAVYNVKGPAKKGACKSGDFQERHGHAQGHIANRFVDWTGATIKAIKCYKDMRYCIEASQDKLRDLTDRMESPKGSKLSDMPRSSGGNKTEDAWVGCIDGKITIEHKLKEARSYMEWFCPAWNRLTETEKILLEERFINKNYSTDSWINSARTRVNYEKTQLYEKSNEAVERLKIMLFAG